MNTNDVYTIREGKIKALPKENLKSWETPFESKEDAILYQVNTGSSHNLTKEEKDIFNTMKNAAKEFRSQHRQTPQKERGDHSL